MPDEHALLSASSSWRWLHCTPSARLEAAMPEETSEYAEEGTRAHAVAEKRWQPAKHGIVRSSAAAFSSS